MNELHGRVGFNVYGYLSGNMGIAVAARNLVDALERHGHPVRGFHLETQDVRSGLNLGWERTKGDWSRVEKVVEWIQCNAPEIQVNWAKSYPEVHLSNRFKVNLSFWELPATPADWVEALNSMDMVITPTQFIEDSFRNSGVVTPMVRMPQWFEIGPQLAGQRTRFGLPETGFLFLSAFDVNSDPSRKNPMAAIDAFERAFPIGQSSPDVCLVVKAGHLTSNPKGEELIADLKARVSKNPQLLLYQDMIPQSDLQSFYANFDAFVSLHRSEGLGLILMEMMGQAKPVLATAFSGNLDFCTPENACLISYEPVRVVAHEPLYQSTMAAHPECFWAEPNIQEAAAWMQRLVTEPALADAIGQRARADMLAWAAEDLSPCFDAVINAAWQHADEMPIQPAVLEATPKLFSSFTDETEPPLSDWRYHWSRFKRDKLGIHVKLIKGHTPQETPPIPPLKWHRKLAERGIDPAQFDNQRIEEMGIEPGIGGEHLAMPSDLKFPGNPVPDFRHLQPIDKDDTLLIIVNHLQSIVYYAGYSIFFDALRTIRGKFTRVVVGVVTQPYEPGLLENLHSDLTVCSVRELPQHIQGLPKLTAVNSALLHHDVLDHLPPGAPLLHYCLESDEVFHLPGPLQLRCQRSIYNSRHLVIHSGLLARYLESRGYLHPEVRLHLAPATIKYISGIQPNNVDRTLFFYFRPEQHNLRNMAAEVWAAAETFATRHAGEGWTLYLMGTVGTNLSKVVAGNDLIVLSKLPMATYQAIISRARAAVALIQAPHPGVIAFQAAASGIPTVTNTYVNRSASDLKQISKNIIPWEPLTQELVDALEEAVQAPHGIPDLDPTIYQGLDWADRPNVHVGHFETFIDQILSTP